MTTMNYGLGGVSKNVQLGKGGARLTYNVESSRFELKTADEASSVRMKGLAGVDSDDFATLSQVQEAAQGLTPKAAVRVATQGPISINGNGGSDDLTAGWTPNPDPGGLGDAPARFTGAPTDIDGITLADGDRVLVRFEGIHKGLVPAGPDENQAEKATGSVAVNQAAAARNGIYVVSGTLGTWIRAADSDTDDEVGYGDFAFVNEGTSQGGNGYVLTKSFESITIQGLPTLDTDAQFWVKFAEADTIVANQGVKREGDTVSLDIDSLSPGNSTLNSTIAFGDNSGGTDSKSTLANILNQANVPHSLTANGIVIKTGATTYASRAIDVSAVAGDEGLSIVNGNGVAGNPTVGLDIVGLDGITTAASGHALVINDGTNNRKVAASKFLDDLGVASGADLGGTGYLYNNEGTILNGTFIAATGTTAGAIVSTTAAGKTTIGIDIAGTTPIENPVDEAIPSLAVTDSVLVHDSSSNTNVKALIGDIVELVAAAGSDNEIAEGNTSIVITDTGSGSIAITVDTAQVATIDADGVQANSLGADDLGASQVVLGGGTGGKLNSSASLKFDDTTLAVTGAVTATSSISGGAINGTSAIIANDATVNGLLTFGTADGGAITSSGNITAVTGTVTAANASFTTLLTAASITDSSLDVTDGVVFANGGNLDQDDGSGRTDGTPFTYNSTTGTLTVENLDVTGDGGLDLAATEVAFGDADADGNATGNAIGKSTFTFDADNDTLQVGTTRIASDIFTSVSPGGDITIAPLGAGQVIIGGEGGGAVEGGTASAIQGGIGLDLLGDTVSIRSSDGQTTYAEFSAGSGSANYITIDSAATGASPVISVEGASDTDIDIVLSPSGDGALLIGEREDHPRTGTYEEAIAGQDNAIPSKRYVDDAISAAVTPGVVATLMEDITFNGGETQFVGNIPAAATVIGVTVNVTSASSAATTVSVTGDGSGEFMADTLNDPEAIGLYEHSLMKTATAETVNAIVNTPGTGAATVCVTYRYN